MIDRVLSFEADRQVVAIKNVTRESDVMEHHFPGFPVFPGALLLEAMAQTAGYLLIRSARERRGHEVLAALATVDRARFLRPTYPGDQVLITASLTEYAVAAAQITARADVAEKQVASARLWL